MSEVPVPAELLLENLQSLRALARRLTRDQHAADDAVQDTVVAAMTHGSPVRGTLGRWLRAILRNTVREQARASRRRGDREARSAPGGGACAPSAADVAGELQLHRRLVELVHGLEEPSRQAVFLRFWRGLEPRAIAELLSVPVKTVHTRIERGLSRLRARLDAERGGRAAWAPVLLAFAGRGHAGSDTAAAVATGVLLLMKTKLVVASSVLVAALLLVPWWWPGEPGNAAPGTAVTGAPVAAAQSSGANADAQRIEIATGAPAVPATEPGTKADDCVTGFVRDLDGRPVAGVEVVFARKTGDATLARDTTVPPATSVADGSFRLLQPKGEGCLTTGAGGWSAVLRPWLLSGAPAEPPVVVVAPSRSYSGTVVDPGGVPVAQARVVVVVGEALVPTRATGGRTIALPNDLVATDTDAQGRFRIAAVGFVPGARVTASRHPHADASVPLPEASTPDLLLRLGAAKPDAQRVHGIVLDHRNRPVEGALVAAAGNAVRTTAEGRFAAPWGFGIRPTVVRALHPDHGAVEAMLLPGPEHPGWEPGNPITLQLPAEPGIVRGRVVDADGVPVAGARVWTPDLTYLGKVEGEEQGHEVSRDSSVEELMAPGNEFLTLATRSDTDGAFALRGLLPRRYAVFAMMPATLAGAGPAWASPGDAVELRLEAPALRNVAGRVRSREGRPLAGLRVSLGRTLQWQRPVRDPDPWTGSPFRAAGAAHLFRDAAVTTDADGRFRCAGVHVAGSYLWFQGDEVFMAPPFQLTPDLDCEQLEVTLPVRSTFRIVLDHPGEADAFRITDAKGGHVTVLVRVEGFEMSMGRIELADGRSPEASSEAREVVVVLLRGVQEVRRAAVRLPEGGGHEVRL